MQTDENNCKQLQSNVPVIQSLSLSLSESESLSISEQQPVIEIINYLNKVCGTNFKPTTKSTKEHINARLDEGYNLNDFIAVIDKKHFEWHNSKRAN